MTVGKLVRDRIPHLIAAEGRTPKVDRLTGTVLRDALYSKLEEEHEELLAAVTDEDRQEELADMIEVLIALASIHGLNEAELMDVVKRKRADRGGFNEGLFYIGDDHDIFS